MSFQQRSDIDNIKMLSSVARELRGKIIETSCKAKVPHLGSCLSCVDILVLLYWNVLDIDPSNTLKYDRDRFILSKGHAAPALYQVLAMKSFFPESMMTDYGSNGSLFGEHPPPHGIPGVEAATGSLGHGLPIGIGMSIASRINGLKNRVYVLMSDGECNEGSVWEAAMMAAAQKLERLMVIIDFNKWQATGRSEDILALNPLKDKWDSFGWSTYRINGHDIEALIPLLSNLPDGSGKPVAIIADTIKGKGVSFMEDDNNWHYRIPNATEVETAKRELGLIE
jgi:transketolase